jgi:toxin ParE1/3/4
VSRKVRRTPRARQDLIDIWAYIAADNERVADRLLDRIDEALNRLIDFPELGRQRPELAKSIRSLPVGRYVIFYRPVSKGIEVVRVLSSFMDVENIEFGDEEDL